MPAAVAGKMLTQVHLVSGSTQLVCWVDFPVTRGQIVRLKNSDDPSRWWDVAETYATRPAASIPRGWDNNI